MSIRPLQCRFIVLVLTALAATAALAASPRPVDKRITQPQDKETPAPAQRSVRQSDGPPGVDENTICLWLFDELPYANVTLTDAGPLRIDLRLETGREKPLPPSLLDGTRGLVKGKFGNALALPLGDRLGVSWPKNSGVEHGTHYMSERRDEVPERCNLGYMDWTIEFWFKAFGAQSGRGVIWELRNEDLPGLRYLPRGFNALILDSNRQRFILRSKFLDPDRTRISQDKEIRIPTDANQLNDGAWHHLAFTFTLRQSQLRHYVDGRQQSQPEKGGFMPLMGQLVSMRVGRDAEGQQELEGMLDEMRLSQVVRYTRDFTPPASFSRNYGTEVPAAGQPSGPPLLFGAKASAGPLELGDRKHLFLDEALIDRHQNVHFTANPPQKFDLTDFHCDRPWDSTPRFGSGVPDICSFWDDGDEIKMLYTSGGMFGGKPHVVCLATSADGVHWVKPDLGQVGWEGSTRNNIVLRIACQGTAFKDPNPAATADSRYKYVAWCQNRGFYVFNSPDGRHWRRNETLALPFDPDGSIDLFWDDQCGLYRAHLRSIRPIERPKVTRSVARAETADILKPWPFTPSPKPAWHESFWASPKPAAGELPIVDTGGEAYRMKGQKYSWAPDAYLAFPWRHVESKNIRPGCFLMVSRDGVNWKRYEPPYYFQGGWTFEGRTVQECLSEQGMIRRGDEIWQYATLRFAEHGGALYGGVDHDGSAYDVLLKYVQRLDGFVSLDAGSQPGTIVTRPLVFSGSRLVLNVAAKGTVRVGLLDETGQPLKGYALADCDPIRVDSVRHPVTWRGRANVRAQAGKVVRLQFELQEAKLYAFEFTKAK